MLESAIQRKSGTASGGMNRTRAQRPRCIFFKGTPKGYKNLALTFGTLLSSQGTNRFLRNPFQGPSGRFPFNLHPAYQIRDSRISDPRWIRGAACYGHRQVSAIPWSAPNSPEPGTRTTPTLRAGPCLGAAHRVLEVVG